MKNILFVDDDPTLRELIERMLGDVEEWRLNFAAGGEDALSLLDAFDYDAMVTDFRMPNMTGIELLVALRSSERNRETPVIILTGSGDAQLKREALDCGATDLLDKPVDREDLVARIRNVIRLKEYQDEIKAHNAVLEQRVRERTIELERSRLDLIWRLGRAGEFRDSETGQHVVRVGYFTLEIARTLGLDADFSRDLFYASPLHDIGKIGIPDRILLKPGRLDVDEWEVMKRHTEMGASILERNVVNPSRLALLGPEMADCAVSDGTNNLVRMSANIALYHHERWDGAGYPTGLRGENIPLEARITTVADVFDALCSRRPYKEPFSLEKVLEIIERGAGSHFDPEVWRAFLNCLPRLLEIREHFRDPDAEPHADVLQPIGNLAIV